MKRIGPKIKMLREKLGLTQQQLADLLGYSSKSMIAHIEKGDSDMTYEKILLLLQIFKIDANELFDIDKKKEEKEEIKINSISDFYNQYDEDVRLKKKKRTS